MEFPKKIKFICFVGFYFARDFVTDIRIINRYVWLEYPTIFDFKFFVIFKMILHDRFQWRLSFFPSRFIFGINIFFLTIRGMKRSLHVVMLLSEKGNT